MPVRVLPLPVPSRPRSAAAVLAPVAVTVRLPTPTLVSVSTRAVPLASIAAVTVGAAAWMASNTSCSVTAPAVLTAFVLPLRSVSVKPANGTTSTPAPLFSTASGIVPSSPRMFTVTPSVVPSPSPPLRLGVSVATLRPVNADTSMVLAPAPPVSSAVSKPAIVSTPPLLVSVRFVSVKLVSPDSNRVSTPAPASITSAPPRPLMRSSPSPPSRLSAPSAPISRSSPAPPRNSTDPVNPEPSRRSAPEVPSTATRWMFARLLNSVVPACVVVAVTTPPPTSPSDAAVIGVWTLPPRRPVKVMIHGPPVVGWDTNTSPWFNALSCTSALCTSLAFAFQAKDSVVCPA